nr:G-type lectin S-receptor-like serine/threonine-protein kinase At1g11300 [Ipomoea batatas]
MEFRRNVRFLTLCQLLFLLISVFFPKFGISRDTITADKFLEGSETILSNSQDFKMGFFSPESSTKYYVGIMFNVPSMAVVWVANRDKPMNDSRGTIGISADGNLIVLDGEKRVVWSTSKSNISTSSSPANTTAQLLDTGNLVLKDSSSGILLWESFGENSDAFLEKMKIGSGVSIDMTNELRSWKSPWDPSPGSFSWRLQPQNIPQVVVQNNSKLYWRSGPWNKQIFIGLPHMNSFYNSGIQIINDNAGGMAYITYTNMKQFNKLHYVLNSTGCFLERYCDEEKNQWVVSWESCGSGQCDMYGKCGPFGVCDPSASNSCSCLQGYKPRNEMEWGYGNWSSGCIRNAALQCHRNNSDEAKTKKDGFLKLKMVKVPDFALWVSSVYDTCETDCLTNCSCIAYSYYTGIGCMHWSEDLIDIQQFSMGGADLYIRLPYSELGSLVIASCMYFGLVKHRGKKWNHIIHWGRISSKNMLREDTSQVELDELPVFNFEIIAKATQNFHSNNKLGQGGFGPVYKGKLEDGQDIAVKRLSKSSAQGQKEFMNEVVVISKLQHRNLVRLLGCCIGRGEKILVYEFMPNGSLDALLFEYAMNGRFSEKSDVYSFGVLLLEIVSGRKNSTFYHDDFAISLVAHAWRLWNSKKIDEVADPEMYEMRFKMSIKRCVHVGLLCVQECANDRPNVSTILSMLSSEIAELPCPKQPAFIGRQSSPDNKSSGSLNGVTISDIEGR